MQKKFLLALPLIAAALLSGHNGHSSKIWEEKSPSEKKETLGDKGALLNSVFTRLVQGLSPAVVNVYTRTNSRQSQNPTMNSPEDLFRFFFGRPGTPFQMPNRESQSLGSGFVIHKDGYIITNSHVVRSRGRNADKIFVKFQSDSASSKGVEAEIIGTDESTDVAVLKLKSKRKKLAVAPLGDSDKLKVGEWVMAIGNPFGHSHSVSQGIVSAMGREIDRNVRTDFIQTDASINPGNSGGPLFNLSGEVIGINTAIDARGPGIGFAIPINVAKNVVKQLVEKGEVTRGWIGVQISDLSPEIAKSLDLKSPHGALVQDVFKGDPADKAGLQSYDVVTKVNGKSVKNSREFLIAVGNLRPGSKVKMEYYRDGRKKDTRLTVAKRDNDSTIAKRGFGEGRSERKDRSKIEEKTGVVLAELNSQLRQRLGVPSTVKGVLVKDVVNGGLGERVGLRSGDIITQINKKAATSLKLAHSLLKKALKKDRGILLKVRRGHSSMILFLGE